MLALAASKLRVLRAYVRTGAQIQEDPIEGDFASTANHGGNDDGVLVRGASDVRYVMHMLLVCFIALVGARERKGRTTFAIETKKRERGCRGVERAGREATTEKRHATVKTSADVNGRTIDRLTASIDFITPVEKMRAECVARWQLV